MSQQPTFRCPRCHGPFVRRISYRTDPATVAADAWECYANTDGESYSGRVAPDAPPLRTYKPCGWRGKGSECRR